MTMSGQNTGAPTSIIIKDVSGTLVYQSTNGTPNAQVTDRYGNYWKFDASGNLVDDRGQTPVLTTVSGNTIYYDVLTTGGGRARYTVTTGTFPVDTQFHQSGVSDYSGSLPNVLKLQLPDGSAYAFNYEPQYGEISGVTLPTGGTIAYKWQTFFDSYNNANRWLASRTVGSDPPTTFTPQVVTTCSSGGTGCQEKMTVHSPGGDETVYNLTLNNGAWNTNTQRFSGAAANGTLMSTTDTSFNFSNTCGPTCTGAKYVAASTVTTTLPIVNLKLTDVYSYADITLGLIGSKKRYDFYSGSQPSNPLIETDYVYGSGVPGDMTSVTTKALAQNNTIVQIAQQTNTYVQSPSSTTSGVTSHGSANAAGWYLSSSSAWLNTDGSRIANAYRIDDAGTLLGVSTPYPSSGSASAWTSFGYDPTDTFPTSKTEPATTSGITLTLGAGFDTNSGLLISSTDYNGQGKTYKSYDAFGRVGEVDGSDGSQTLVTYTPTTRSTTTKLDSSRSSVFLEMSDALGRPNRTASANGQSSSPYYQHDTCYNSNGQVQSVSTPYSGPGFSGSVQCSGTSYTYDALGRPLTITNADGTVQYSYTGRATKTVDVNGVTKITQIDALGRIKAVCEVTSQTMGGVAPQSCGLDIAGTGFLTTYTYDPGTFTTTIQQGGQTRKTVTDSLGRTVSTSEPERGTTTYAYAYNASGLQVTRTRPKANPSSPGSLRVLWREQHPKAHEQGALNFVATAPVAEHRFLFRDLERTALVRRVKR